VRHARPALVGPDGTDHGRTLTEEGRRQADVVGRRLADLGWAPDLVLASDARRCRETWDGLAPHVPAPARFLRELYYADPGGILDLLAREGGEAATVMLLGHNPAQGAIVARLSGAGLFLRHAEAALLAGAGPSWRVAIAGRFRVVDMVSPG